MGTLVYDEDLDAVVAVVIASNIDIPVEPFAADLLDLLERTTP